MSTLVTHTDFDGIACAVLVSSVEPIVEIRFEEPREMQSGNALVAKGAIICDLPYHKNCSKWFDHHPSVTPPAKFEGAFDPASKSAARVVFEYYDNPFLRQKFEAMVEAADKIDSATFLPSEVAQPSGYYLLSVSLDACDTPAESRAYKQLLIDLLKKKPLEEVLGQVKVAQKCKIALERLALLENELPKYTKMVGSVAVVDLREAPDWVKKGGGRFLVYLQNPNCVASVRVRKTLAGNADFSMGENIFSRRLKTDLSKLAASFGGGGHAKAAGFQVPLADAEAAISKIVEKINGESD